MRSGEEVVLCSQACFIVPLFLMKREVLALGNFIFS